MNYVDLRGKSGREIFEYFSESGASLSEIQWCLEPDEFARLLVHLIGAGLLNGVVRHG